MTDQNQLLREAMERLVCMCEHYGDFRNGVTDPTGSIDEGVIRATEVIRAARAALDAPAQPQGAGEAVAVVRVQHGYWSRGHFHESKRWHAVGLPALENLPDGTKLYTTPPASQQAAQAVPEGWQLVPIEPTAEMISAALRDCGGIGGGSCGEHTGVDGSDFADVWGAMLRAAKGEQ